MIFPLYSAQGAFAFERTALRKVLYNFHMPNYRRSYYGSTYFFTVVTYNRRPILTSEAARNLSHTTWIDVQNSHPFTTDAICLLPDYIHCLWTLPEGDANYSTISTIIR